MTPPVRFALLLAALASPAHAIVGGGAPAADGVGRHVVAIVGSRGNFCSGALIARDIVLTAAHCVAGDATYKLVDYSGGAPQLRDIAVAAIHPGFKPQAFAASRATADVALLRLTSPPPGKAPAALGAPRQPIAVGSRFTVAGIGVSARGDGKSGGAVRAVSLIATGKPGTLQLRLVDAATGGAREGLGACTGDSGAPAFEDQDGRAVIVGVVSWSTGPNLTAGCGGLTGVTPLTLYRDWIVKTSRGWGAGL